MVLKQFELKGKVAMLTGSTRGLGEVSALALAKAGADIAVCGRNTPDLERTPMGRWGHLPEMEGIIIFLASPASDFITGQTIYIDGGWTIW